MDHPAAFDKSTADVRAAIDLVLDQAEVMLPLVADAKRLLGDCDMTVALMRRAEDEIGQGPLNSVGAVQQSHKGLAKALETFNQHLLHLFDIRRELTGFHASVSDAVKLGIERQAQQK